MPNNADRSGAGHPHFLEEPESSPEALALFHDDQDELGYVMNLTRLWSHLPTANTGLFDLLGAVTDGGELTFRQRAILVAACASTLGDSYCSLAWGSRLAQTADTQTSVGVITGSDEGLTPAERAMAGWARRVADDPNGTGPDDVEALRRAGFTDRQIFAITVFVALRLAFSTVNDALGARPDKAYRDTVPEEVRRAVDYGRPIAD